MSLALTTLINKKKGVHPYDYMDGFDKFDKKGLPSIEKNYSKLTCEDISNSDYNHAKNVSEEFKCKQWEIIIIFI